MNKNLQILSGLREILSLSVAQLSDETKISEQQILFMENGCVPVSYQLLDFYSGAFRVRPRCLQVLLANGDEQRKLYSSVQSVLLSIILTYFNFCIWLKKIE